MLEHIHFYNSLNTSSYVNVIPKEFKPVYIISQNLLNNKVIDINKLMNNQLSQEEKNALNFINRSDEILSLKQNKKEFFIIDNLMLPNLGFQENMIGQAHIYFFKYNSSEKYLIFSKENKILKIQFEKNSILSINNDIKTDIISCLILLYTNEKELKKKFDSNIIDEYDLKKYYLVNKKWIETFKSIFNYNEVCKILSKCYYNYNSYNGYVKNIESFFELSELTNIVQNINEIPNCLKNEIKLYPDMDNSLKEYQCPVNFELVPKSLFNLLKQITKSIDERDPSKLKYKILIGNSTLYIQDNHNSNYFYIYSGYKNSLLTIINYFKEKYFYLDINKYLKKENMLYYIAKKNVDINKIDIPQDIYAGNKGLGKLILKYKFTEKLINDQIKNKNYSIYKNYKNFQKSILNLQRNNIDLSNNNYIYNIEILLSKRELKYLPVYLIEENQMNYCKKNLSFENFDLIENIIDENLKKNMMNQFKPDNLNNNINIEIISEYKINFNIRYMLVDETFCKDMELPYEKYKPFELMLLLNNKDFLLFFKNSKKLLKMENIKNISFNLSIFENKNNSKEAILSNLIKLYNSEREINNLLKNDKNNTSYECYIINKKWIQNYKKFYNYDSIIQKMNETGQNVNNNYLLSVLNNNKLLELFMNENNLCARQEKIFNNNGNEFHYPVNFEIVQKNVFDLIINEINTTNRINFGQNLNSVKIVLANNRIYIKYIQNYFYIGSYVNGEYKINYIIIINDKEILNKILNHLFNSYFGNEEEYLEKIKLDINKVNIVQNIINKNNIIGNFISIFPYNQTRGPSHCLGLQNIGATCYMNATLQCLCHINSLKKYFKDLNQLKQDISNKDYPLTKVFYQVITNLWKESNISYYIPETFKNKISELNPLFRGIQANDSKDLILFIFETLHNELNNPSSNSMNLNDLRNMNIPNELKIFRENYYSNNYSIISKIFYFEQSNNLKCCFCNYNKLSFNIINCIIFPLEKVRLFLVNKKPNGFENVTLEDCFEQSEDPELLNGANRIYCNNCGNNSDALSSNKLYNCPEILTIILNRGKGLEFNVEFKFPMYLNISKYIIEKTNHTKYELIGVLTHLGPSGMSGHFIAFCKSPVDRNWYCYNDAQVKKCKDAESEINSCGIPYILFYEKIIKKDFVLYFVYNGKEVYLEIKENLLFSDVIKQLYSNYSWIPREGVGFYIMKNENMELLMHNKRINENNLKNEDKIIIA